MRPMPIEPPEVVQVDRKEVMCDGDNGVAGHPRVFLTLGAHDHVDCPYCDRRFQLKAGAHKAAGGH